MAPPARLDWDRELAAGAPGPVSRARSRFVSDTSLDPVAALVKSVPHAHPRLGQYLYDLFAGGSKTDFLVELGGHLPHPMLGSLAPLIFSLFIAKHPNHTPLSG